jgi:hypothetical protein
VIRRLIAALLRAAADRLDRPATEPGLDMPAAPARRRTAPEHRRPPVGRRPEERP